MTPIPVPCPQCGAVLKIRDPKLIGHKAKCPKCGHPFRLEAAVVAAVAEGTEQAVQSAAEFSPQPSNPNPAPSIPGPTELPSWPTEGVPTGAANKLQLQRKKNRKRALITASISGLVLLAAGIIGIYAMKYRPKQRGPDVPANVAAAPALAEDEQVADIEDVDDDAAAKDRQPIDLQYIPAGTRIAIHLRPAELWEPNSRGEEFRFCLGPISEFVGAKIKELTKREPSEIEEALFCLIPNERGTPPDLAAVFHLKEEAKKSELLDQFGGRRGEGENNTPYYLTPDNRAYLFPDLKTVAVCPAKDVMVSEMISAINDRNPTSPGIEELLFLTDRARPVTVVFEPVSTRIDAEFLMPALAIPLLEQFCEWLGPDVETVVWSADWKKDDFQSEIIARNQGGREARALARQFQKQLRELAENVLHVVQQMSPKEVGKRKVIGRFPAMTKAFSLASRTQAGPRYVKVTTELPTRAAPNLALGALLAWDESTRTLLKSKSPEPESTADQPDTTPIAEKIKRKITVEFKREPLQGAFSYIANEIKAKLEIDGDALKLSAYTKNMPQTFVMEDTPAVDVIKKILTQPTYEKMCLVLDEQKNTLLITTYPVAEQQGLKPYVFDK